MGFVPALQRAPKTPQRRHQRDRYTGDVPNLARPPLRRHIGYLNQACYRVRTFVLCAWLGRGYQEAALRSRRTGARRVVGRGSMNREQPMFRGSFTALVTPFKGGKVDERAFQQLVEWQIAEGTHGLVPVGT